MASSRARNSVRPGCGRRPAGPVRDAGAVPVVLAVLGKQVSGAGVGGLGGEGEVEQIEGVGVPSAGSARWC